MVTFLTKVETILNSRPLTQLSDDINDFNALTTNHFILRNQPLCFSPVMIKGNHVTNTVCWKAVQG